MVYRQILSSKEDFRAENAAAEIFGVYGFGPKVLHVDDSEGFRIEEFVQSVKMPKNSAFLKRIVMKLARFHALSPLFDQKQSRKQGKMVRKHHILQYIDPKSPDLAKFVRKVNSGVEKYKKFAQIVSESEI